MLTKEDYDKRYLVLREMTISLDADPVVTGLQSLTKKLAEVQDLRNRVGKAFAEAIQNTSEHEIVKSTLKAQLEAEMAKAMMTDDFVKGQKSKELREAAAQTKMPELVLQLHYKEVELVRAEAYEKYVKQIHDTLEAGNNNLSRQISVVQMSIQIGEIDASQLSGTISLKKQA